MTPRVLPAIARIIDQPGWYGTKIDVAKAVCCHPKTAARVLSDLWLNNNLYVKAWMRSCGGPLPVFAKRTKGQQDAPRTRAKTPIEKKRARLADPEKRERINYQQKLYRMTKKVLSGEVRIGVWGL